MPLEEAIGAPTSQRLVHPHRPATLGYHRRRGRPLDAHPQLPGEGGGLLMPGRGRIVAGPRRVLAPAGGGRNPKPAIPNSKQARSTKLEIPNSPPLCRAPRHSEARTVRSPLGFRIFGFEFVSDFGLRISDFKRWGRCGGRPILPRAVPHHLPATPLMPPGCNRSLILTAEVRYTPSWIPAAEAAVPPGSGLAIHRPHISVIPPQRSESSPKGLSRNAGSGSPAVCSIGLPERWALSPLRWMYFHSFPFQQRVNHGTKDSKTTG